MPFFPALPEYHPAITRPVEEFAGGLTAGTNVMMRGAQAAGMREAVQQQRARTEAQKQFAQTGDPAALMASAPDLYIKMNEEQRKATDYAIEDAQRQLAFASPDTYGATRQNLLDRHGAKNPGLRQALDVMLPKAGATAEQLQGFSTRLGTLQGEMQAKAAGAKASAVGQAETKEMKERYRTISQPEQAQAHKNRMELEGLHYSNQLGLQQNRQNFEYMQQNRRLKFEEGFKLAQIEGRTQDHLISSVESYNHAIDAKALEMKKKAAEAYQGPELTEQERKIDAMVEVAKRDNLKMVKPFFDKAKVPFVYNIKDYSRTGPPPGTDPDFDEIMAKAQAIPDPVKRGEAIRKLIDMFNRRDAVVEPAPATEAPAAVPAPAPAPAAPTPPPKPAAAPAPKPAAAPAPTPTPAPAAPTPAPAYTGTIGDEGLRSPEIVTRALSAVGDALRSAGFSLRTKEERDKLFGSDEEFGKWAKKNIVDPFSEPLIRKKKSEED